MDSQIPPSPPPSQESIADAYAECNSFIYTDADGDQYTVTITNPDGNPHCHVISDFDPKHRLWDSQ